MRVEFSGDFWCGPARPPFTGRAGGAARQRVARVVEVHDLLEAFEVAVLRVCLHERGVRPLVDIADRHGAKSAVERRGECVPRGIAVLGAPQETADAEIDKGLALGTRGRALTIRLRLR